MVLRKTEHSSSLLGSEGGFGVGRYFSSCALGRWGRLILLLSFASGYQSASAQSVVETFGTESNQFTMEFVPIGNPNNVADTTGSPNPAGSVAYSYNLGKQEVSRDMINKANTAGGLGITMADMSRWGGNGVNRPATGITWNEAATYVNWLNTSTGGTPAYKFVGGTFTLWSPGDAGYNPSNQFRNSRAKYVIASNNEWYKGAYGNRDGTWNNYATGSDSAPTAVASGTAANTAVYSVQGPADVTSAGGLSPYGTMGQSGNVWEWNETAYDGINNTAGDNREVRGGTWGSGASDYLDASLRFGYSPTYEWDDIGFRVAVVSAAKLNPTVTVNVGSYTYNGSYQGPGVSDVNKGGSTGALTLQYGGSSMVGVQYGPATIPPIEAGNYTLVATVAADANYSQGIASANFTISKATATVNISGTDQIYDGTPKQVAVNTSPENLPVTIMYSGSSAAPTLVGDYSVMATVTSPNYSGAASGRVLKIAKGTPLLSGITATSIAAGQALSTSTIRGTAKNAGGFDVSGIWAFNNASSTPSVGTSDQGATFTPTDTTNYNTASTTISVTVLEAPPNNFTSTINNGEVTITGYTGAGGAVVIPGTIGGSPVTSIGNFAFQSKSNLIAVSIPNGVTTIGSNAFADCANLASVTIPGSVTLIMSGAFFLCPELTTISIPSSVDEIQYNAFFNCYKLASVYFLRNTPPTIGADAFKNIASGAVGYYPAGATGYASLSISGLTFEVTASPASDFTRTTDGTSVTITGYTGTGGAVVIPATIGGLPVRVIGYRAFDGNKQITGVVVSEGVTHIGAEAFQRCNNLASIALPTTLVEIGSYAFLDCKIKNLEIPEGVIEIKNNAFMGCGFMETVQLPSTLIQIGNGAFGYCAQLTEIIIPTNVRNIGVNAFQECGLLEAVIFQGVIPPDFDGNAFSGIANRVTVYYPATPSAWEDLIISGLTLAPYPFSYTIANGNVTITGYTGTGGAVVIPATIGGLPVTQIGNAAFKYKSTITAIALPDSVLSIGYEAFYRCEYLATVSLGSGVTTIGDWAFGHCYRLKSISIPNSVTSLGNGSLSDCIELESVTLGNQVPSLGRYTFTNDYQLTSITLPVSITSIGEQAFSHCRKLATVNFQQSMPPSVNADSFMDIAIAAEGYFLPTAMPAWSSVSISGLTFPQIKASQTITYNGLGNLTKAVGDPNFTLVAIKGASSSPLAFSSSSPSVATITASGLVSIVGQGSTTLSINQAGDATYNAAPSINVFLTVSGSGGGTGGGTGGGLSTVPAPVLNLPATLTYGQKMILPGAAQSLQVLKNVNQTIPDGTPESSMSSSAMVSGLTGSNYSFTLAVKIVPVATGGGFLGDLRAYLRHELLDENDGTLVNQTRMLIDRIGVTQADLVGSLADGLNVIFGDSFSNNIQDASAPDGSLLSGNFAPASSFAGTDPARAGPFSGLGGTSNLWNGTYTLVVADMSTGAEMKLDSWSMQFHSLAASVGVGNPLVVGNPGEFSPEGGLTYEIVENGLGTQESGLGKIEGNQLEAKSGTGTITIRAKYAATGTSTASDWTPKTITLSKASQTITFNPPDSVSLFSDYVNLGATTSSGLAVTYTSQNTGVATIDTYYLRPLAAGDVDIRADAAGNANYENAGTVIKTIHVLATPIKPFLGLNKLYSQSSTNGPVAGVVQGANTYTYEGIQYAEAPALAGISSVNVTTNTNSYSYFAYLGRTNEVAQGVIGYSGYSNPPSFTSYESATNQYSDGSYNFIGQNTNYTPMTNTTVTLAWSNSTNAFPSQAPAIQGEPWAANSLKMVAGTNNTLAWAAWSNRPTQGTNTIRLEIKTYSPSNPYAQTIITTNLPAYSTNCAITGLTNTNSFYQATLGFVSDDGGAVRVASTQFRIVTGPQNPPSNPQILGSSPLGVLYVASGGDVVGTLASITDEDSGDVVSVELPSYIAGVSNDNWMFLLEGNQLKLRTSEYYPGFGANNQSSYSIVLRARDNYGLYADTAYKIVVRKDVSNEISFTGPQNTEYDSYPKSFSASAVSGAQFAIAYQGRNETFYATSGIAPTNAGDYMVTATVTDLDKIGSKSQEFTIRKATPRIDSLPTATTIAYGQALSSSGLSGGAASVQGTFTWTSPSTAPTVGISSQSVTFTPTDSANYETATTLVSVTGALDPAGDEDGDGLSNAQELSLGTNPYQKDSDSDGVLDSREIADGTNPNSAASYNSLNKGLVAYYPFNGNANDESGNGNNGSSFNLSYEADSIGGQAAYFNGTAGVTVPESSSLHLGSRFTMTTWVKIANWDGKGENNGHPMIGAGGVAGQSETAFSTGLTEWSSDLFISGANDYPQNSKTLNSRSYDPATDISNVGSQIPTQKLAVVTSRWQMLTWVYDGQTVSAYLDGVPLKTLSSANAVNISPYQGWQTMRIGYDHDSGKLAGSLDNVRIYNRALSANEVGQLYQTEAGNLDTDRDGLTDAWERGFGRYQIVIGSSTWEQAKTDAEAKGGHLATITSEAEENSVLLQYSNQGGLLGWIGLFSQLTSWRWVTGEDSSYRRWYADQPEGQGGLGSGVAILANGWNDFYAADTLASYVLEFGYPTDPNLADTDGDGFNDSIESHYASDPNNPAVTPNTIRPAGAVIAWGSNSDGQTIVPSNLTDVIQVGGGEHYSAALRRSGEVVAWGNNGWQQTNVPERARSNVVEISPSASRGQTVLLGSGEVLFWGDSGYGQNSIPDEAKHGIVAVSAGSRHSMALTAAGEVLVWGDNQYGQTSVPTDARSAIRTISAGGYHSLALTKSGRVVAWGDNSNGATTVPVECNSGIVAIAGGDQHSLALTVDGKVLAWGNPLSGATTVPTAALSGVKQISASGASSYALKQDGTILAWGRGAEGQLNVPATYQNSYLSVRGGYHHSLAIIPAPSGTPPVITSTSTLIGTVGVPLEYSVTASGSVPITYSASNLPANLTINTNSGLISGTPTAAGSGTATITASNAFGTANQITAFVIAKGTPLLSGITATSIVAGQRLSTSIISGTAVNESRLSVAGIFTFVTPTTTPALGTGTQSIVFTPSDTANYNTATASVSVTVALDPRGDEDGDGATNEEELAAGTDPYDSASGPYQPVAFGDAFTAKLAAGMTTKVTTASMISNDKYSGIPGETRGVTFVSATGTSTGGASIRVKGGWLIYQPSPSAQNGTNDTFTYTVTNGIKTATGTVTVSLVVPNYVAEVAIDRVSGSQVYFSVMPGMTFEVQGTSQLGTSPIWATITGPNNGNWTSGADGRLIVTDPEAVVSASRFYKFRWIP